MANILIIDDDKTVLKILSEMIRTLGHQPVTAQNAEEGLKQFKKNKIDINLVDVKMPGKTGLDFLRDVKTIDNNAVVIIITGYPSSETITETILLNGFTYLEKPITIEKLRVIIEKGLKTRRELNENISS